jgi:haloalkane dehalogenase
MLHGDGFRQAYIDAGPRNAELTFVFLHGNPTWSYLWREFIDRLSRSYRVIAVDHMGFGRSDKPNDPSYYSVLRHMDNLGALLAQALGDVPSARVVLVVHDWGGPIGMAWAERHTQRVAGIVVLNSFAFVQDPPVKLPWLFKWLVLGKGGWKRVTQKNFFVEFFLGRGGPRRLTDAELDPYRAPFPTPAERVGMARFPQLIPETANREHESWTTIAAIERELPKLRAVPALICWAMKDRGFGSAVRERWERVFNNVDGPHLLPNAGHFLQEDAPGAILAEIERWSATLRVDGTAVAGARNGEQQ